VGFNEGRVEEIGFIYIAREAFRNYITGLSEKNVPNILIIFLGYVA